MPRFKGLDQPYGVRKVAIVAEPSFLDRLLGLFRGPPPRDPEPAPAPTPAKIDFDFEDRRIPEAARPKISKIQSLIADIQERAAADTMWSPILFELRQMGDVHLPTLLKSYIDIPAAHRAEIFRKTGHSASFILNDGLDKMATRLREMSASLAQGNLDAFTANMRFIDGRYGAGFAPLD
jgi:hypothetical protein